jgi:hypothetical protein
MRSYAHEMSFAGPFTWKRIKRIDSHRSRYESLDSMRSGTIDRAYSRR